MRRKQVTAFVDWNSQIANAGQKAESRVERQVKATTDYVAEQIASILASVDKTADLFQVEMRVYYGWYRGLTATPSRQVLAELVQSDELPLLKGKARFDWTSPFGDML